MRLWTGALALTTLMGCSGMTSWRSAEEPGARSSGGRGTAALGADEVAEIEAAVQSLRGLRFQRDVEVEWLSDAEWSKALAPDGREVAGAVDGLFDEALAFDELPGDFDAESEARLRAWLGDLALRRGEDVAGVYAPGSGRVYLQASALTERVFARAVLAHELTHALQEQNFTFREVAGRERRFAYDALVEGDATLTMLAYARRRERGEPALMALAAGDGTPEGETSLPVLKYYTGLRFASALAFAGGTALLDRAYADPPTRSEQILHPDRYLAGAPSLGFAPPRAPLGYTVVAGGSQGELMLRRHLAGCLPQRPIPWRPDGDAYTIARGAHGRTVLLWNTAWASEADAKGFAAAVDQRRDCRRERRAGDRWIDGSLAVRRRGARVALVRGMRPPGVDDALDAMLAEPAREVAGPERQDRASIALAGMTQPPGPELDGRDYRDRFLGVRAALPAGWSAFRGGDTARGTKLSSAVRLYAERIDRDPIVGYVVYRERRASREAMDAAYRELADAVAGAWSVKLEPVADGTRETPVGMGHSRSWRGERGLRLEVAIVPICGGEAMIALAAASAARPAEIDAWFQAVVPTGPPLACAWIDPLAGYGTQLTRGTGTRPRSGG